MPTKDEYVTLFGNNGYSSGAWSWDATSKSATHTNGLAFPASGYRRNVDGSLYYVGTYGFYWSASPSNASDGYHLLFFSSSVSPGNYGNRALGLPVRCVRESN